MLQSSAMVRGRHKNTVTERFRPEAHECCGGRTAEGSSVNHDTVETLQNDVSKQVCTSRCAAHASFAKSCVREERERRRQLPATLATRLAPARHRRWWRRWVDAASRCLPLPRAVSARWWEGGGN